MSDDENTPDEFEEESHRARRAALLHVPGPMNDAPPWVLTYADLVSQLNGLFILMLTFAHFIPAEFRQLSGSVEAVFGRSAVNSGTVEVPPPEADVPATPSSAETQRGLLEGLRTVVARHGGQLRGGNVEVEVLEDYRGVTLRMGESALFDAGEAIVRPGAWVFLDAVGELLEREPSRLDVEVRLPRSANAGAPEPTALAARRATRVAQYLLGRDPGLDPSRLAIRAVGVAENASPLPTAAGRSAADRVDFVFSRSAAQVEPPP